jgi:hypothetical protein
MTGRGFRVLLALLVGGVLAAPRLQAQTPEEVQKQAEEERRRKEALMPADALERQRIEQLDLMSKEWEQADVERLTRMHPDEIVKMQIVGLAWDRDTAKTVRCGLPFGVGSRDELEAVLALIKAAPKHEPRAEMATEAYPDRALVVQPWHGEPFAIRYTSGLMEPFAGLESRGLKEALLALEGGQHRITIIHLVDDQIVHVVHTYAIAPHLGGHATDSVDAKLNLARERGLTLALTIHTGVEDLMKDEQPMRYGEVKVFKSKGPGVYVVMLNIPDAHWEAAASDH